MIIQINATVCGLPVSAGHRKWFQLSDWVAWGGLRACASVLPASDSCLGGASGRAGQGARSVRVAAPEAPLRRLSGSRSWAAGAGSPGCGGGRVPGAGGVLSAKDG